MTLHATVTTGASDTQAASVFLDEVVAGLTSTPKRLPSKYFYDERGSLLFEEICELDEYYLTRTELAIMTRHVEEMAELIGDHALLIEPGSGASIKVRLLLRHLRDAVGYVPIDISGDHLTRWAHLLHKEQPRLPILPVSTDFTKPFRLPPMPEASRRVIYFPGSTIGNFTPKDASTWLRQMGEVVGRGGGLLIGVDTKKDVKRLEDAYNDRRGITAAFNLNMLERIRDELGADVDVGGFDHRAIYNEVEGRIEMHLVSREQQTFRVDDTIVRLDPGETIHTENSYKYDLEGFRDLLASAGWHRVDGWTDERSLFSVHYCEFRPKRVFDYRYTRQSG